MTSEEAKASEDAAPSPAPAEVEALVGMPSDPTGSVTFERFRWQAKLAVRAWLGSLAGDGVLAVVCEHVEDLTVVESTAFRFAQLKTRDKGSWTTAKVCESGHAVHRLAQSYLAAEAAGIVDRSRFEVWLEGPPSEAKATRIFFDDPTQATADVKRKIREFGVRGRRLDDFLSKLTVHCHQPARPSVDAVIVRSIGAIWPALTMDQVEQLYETLLQAAESAQAASEPPPSVRAAMTAAQVDPASPDVWGTIDAQALTAPKLRALCPPLPADSDQDLLARAATGEATVLELKLTRAGASHNTVQAALLARADADVSAAGSRASGVMSDSAEQALDTRVLTAAQSIAALAALSGTTLVRPAEHIFHTLMSNVADTSALDVAGLFGHDHRLVVGHLCSVSDQCRYAWGLA